jgi:hypothetical protein
MNTRMRRLVLFAALAGTLGLVIFDFIRDERATTVSTRPARDVRSADTKGQGPSLSGTGGDPRLLTLPERSPLGGSRTGLFSSHSWQSPASKSAAIIAAAPVAPGPPPMPYRFAGTLVQDGKLQVLLANGDAVIPVRVGESIDGGYRVESIGEDQITLIYLPLGKKEVIPIFSSLLPTMAGALARAASNQVAAQLKPTAAASNPDGGAVPRAPVQTAAVVTADPDRENAPAQLLWHGPNQVKLGARFEVALKVTSGQPLQASPMQLSFDPAYFEFVAARPGKFFGGGDRNFSYRAGPDGSIFVGATSQNPAPAADAELLVLTFRPLKAAPAAELSIASLILRGPAGRTIAFDPLVAFTTTITP